MPVDAVSTTLLRWYDAHARALPWRSPPGLPPPPPYRVWLSEIMLQQTTTAAVAPYFARFLARWPGIDALAAADDADVMREWAGLGYYARARNLLACARAVVGRGGFPDTEAGLRELPGIGAYTAAAIASIAFDRRAVVVDGNVERVVARLFAIDTPLPAAKRALYDHAASITPDARAGDHAQAMMDLGAGVCTPRAPKCDVCPLAGFCMARARGEAERFPVKLAKAAKPVRFGTAWWIEHDGAVLLVRRPDKGLLGGMLGLPTSELRCAHARHPGEGRDPFPDGWEMGPGLRRDDGESYGTMHILPTPVRHVFTHFELRLTIIVVRPPTRPTLPGPWHPVATIADAGLPTLFARAAAAVLAARAAPALSLETAA